MPAWQFPFVHSIRSSLLMQPLSSPQATGINLVDDTPDAEDTWDTPDAEDTWDRPDAEDTWDPVDDATGTMVI